MSRVATMVGRQKRGIADTHYVSMGAHLRGARLRMGWSVRYTAARFGLYQGQLEEWESGIPIQWRQFRRLMGKFRRAQHRLTQHRQTDAGRLD